MKIAKLILSMLVLPIVLTLTSCENTTYIALSDFYYSSDAGKTYGNQTKEFVVGQTIYMQLIVRVDSNSDDLDEINITLTIPSITSVDAKYYDGQPITPITDEILNITKYPFVIIASKTSQEWPFTFQFIPNNPGEITMTLTFDEKVNNAYDKQNTVSFVNPVS